MLQGSASNEIIASINWKFIIEDVWNGYNNSVFILKDRVLFWGCPFKLFIRFVS